MNKTSLTEQMSLRFLPKSIQGRLLFASLFILPIFCGVLGFSLDRAFTQSLRTGAQAQLTLQAYALIAAAEFEDNQLWLPEQLTEPRLNQPSSELFAAIYTGNKNRLIWRSDSALQGPLLSAWQSRSQQYGEPFFGSVSQDGNRYSFLQYNVFWQDATGHQHPYQFVIFESDTNITKQISAYRQSLWGWLSAIALSITLLQFLIMRWGLSPIRKVSNDLKRIQTGQLTELSSEYCSEINELTNGINTLLANEQQQRSRYKNTLSDLAHSLKTPLAIMQGGLQSTNAIDQKEFEQQINRIDQIISHQLKRGIVAPNNPFSNAIPVKASCESIVSALTKVYRDKPTKVTINLSQNLLFRGDEGDLLEVLGNLLDNAFKYGNGIIEVTGETLSDNKIKIAVEDNGLGVKREQYTQLLMRGERADTTQAGQGIGLAVVTDIVSSYRGSVELTPSNLGGLRVLVQL